MPRTAAAAARSLAVVVVPLVLLSLVAGCEAEADGKAAASGKGGQAQRDPVAVTLAPARAEPLERTVEIKIGTLYGDEETTISAKVAGRVQQILADVGDRVSAGAPLAQIDPTDYQLTVAQREAAVTEALAELGLTELPAADFDVTKVATVERARFQAANAKAKLDRARQLFEAQPPLISEQDFADIETAYEVAVRDHEVAELSARSQLALARTRQSELESARQMLADATVRAPSARDVAASAVASTAPSDGRYAVAERRVEVGEYVAAGAPMFRLVADDPIKFRGAVPERFVNELRVGQPVTIRVESAPEAFAGTVSRVNPAIDPQSRTFQIEALFDNDRQLLRPGAFARGTVRVGEDPDVTFVPRESIVSFAGVDKVYTVADGKAVEHVIRQGPVRGDYVAVREGLTGQPQVVVTGAGKLAKDVPVQVTTGPGAPSTQPTATAATR
jgi:multidrug efflux pump subunit AcrA (membrane-fusion protein)